MSCILAYVRDFRKSGHRTRRLLRTAVRSVGALVLLVLAVVSVRAAWNMYQTFVQASTGEGETVLQLAALKEQEAGVEASIERLSTERGLEAEVRERYGLGKPGESKIAIVRDAGAGSGTDTTHKGSAFVRFLRSLFVW